MKDVASLSQGRTAAAQCGLFTHKSVPVIFEPPCTCLMHSGLNQNVIFAAVILIRTVWSYMNMFALKFSIFFLYAEYCTY